ncbi:hypothetical protein Pint_16934 [Pistacia integerrima]|uniref:Uncharacterized protein n=1 Tax=Pistacia integerrima TaxID=434235 RepID=A0ACC0ZHT5_9ROSI|nr:hypothetical protein Pint_16934 [Pistacia integerrima]
MMNYVIIRMVRHLFLGALLVRVANRIKEGKFTLDGTKYTLPINKLPKSLHVPILVQQKLVFCFQADGFKGYDKVIWKVAEQKNGENPSITFKYHNRDGEEGYPRDVSVTAGHNCGNILEHSIQIGGPHITPVDENTVPTGEIKPIRGTPFDFTSKKKIGASIHEVGLGYDHNYVLDCGEDKSGLKHAVKLKDPSSSRVLNLWTNAPGMQFYTGNYVNGVVGIGGAVYGKHAGVCLETQGYPNAINQSNFPSVVVRPGEIYKHSMLCEFSVE